MVIKNTAASCGRFLFLNDMRIHFLFLLFFFVACRNHQIVHTDHQPKSKNLNKEVYFSNKVDSLDILYFNKPYTDKERYQRYYKVVHTTDTAFINTLTIALQQNIVEDLQHPKKCMSEGKIILPLGGDAYKMIYFSRKETNCPYIYIIKDGHFLYYSMDAALNKLLNTLESTAVEP